MKRHLEGFQPGRDSECAALPSFAELLQVQTDGIGGKVVAVADKHA